MGAAASAQFGPTLDLAASKPSDGSDLQTLEAARAEAVMLRRVLAAIRQQVAADGGAAAFEHLGPDGSWERYSPEQSCLIAVGLGRDPNGQLDLPGGPFQVRFGRSVMVRCGISAFSQKIGPSEYPRGTLRRGPAAWNIHVAPRGGAATGLQLAPHRRRRARTGRRRQTPASFKLTRAAATRASCARASGLVRPFPGRRETRSSRSRRASPRASRPRSHASQLEEIWRWRRASSSSGAVSR